MTHKTTHKISGASPAKRKQNKPDDEFLAFHNNPNLEWSSWENKKTPRLGSKTRRKFSKYSNAARKIIKSSTLTIPVMWIDIFWLSVFLRFKKENGQRTTQVLTLQQHFAKWERCSKWWPLPLEYEYWLHVESRFFTHFMRQTVMEVNVKTSTWRHLRRTQRSRSNLKRDQIKNW